MRDQLRESVGNCYCCKKELFRDEADIRLFLDEADKCVYTTCRVVCLHHHGITEWYKEMMKQLQNDLVSIGIVTN